MTDLDMPSKRRARNVARQWRHVGCVAIVLMAAGCLHNQKDPLSRSEIAANVDHTPISSERRATSEPTTEATTEPTTGPTTKLAAGATSAPTSRPTTTAAKPRPKRSHLYLADDPKLAADPYWLSLPSTAIVDCANYDAIWNGAQVVLRDKSFLVDRLDYRDGYLTSLPLVSMQAFEPWRNDVADAHSLIESTISSVQRIVYFQITKQPSGSYQCVIKVVVQRQSSAERRITSVQEYRDVFSATRAIEEGLTDEEAPVQLDYYYAFRRDAALEHELARKLRQQLAGQSCEN